jgi:hypothetical protein
VFGVFGEMLEECLDVRCDSLLNQLDEGGVRKWGKGRFNDLVNEEPPATGDGEEVVHTSCFVVENDGLASVPARAVPTIGWFERVVHDQPKRKVVENAGVKHLSVPWFEHAQFLNFSGEEYHGQNKERECFFVHVVMMARRHLNMCSQG